ncbi:MAG: histidine phosphatase family protein [Firmicutes bacterium]|nr:histidine phosphatase family protein [Bacillota bacterium]
MLWIIRHGLTEWNVRHKLQGQTDIPLNDEGKAQAKAEREELADIHLDICFCSPLARARETAMILLEGRDIPIIFDERLKEMNFGLYEGLEHSFDIPDCPINIFFQHPERYDDQLDDEKRKGAETMEELFTRTGDFLREVIYPRLEKGEDILIVGHGAMNSSIVCQVKHLPLAEFWSAGIPQCKRMRLL